MVSQLSLVFIVVAAVLSLLVPALTFYYCKKKLKISVKPVVVGALVWIIFTQILEAGVHLLVLNFFDFRQYPYLFVLYGGLMAGLFEEVGRYLAFRDILERFRAWKDGIAYGIGHGGIESIFIGLLGSIQLFVFALAINSNQLDKILGDVPRAQVQPLLDLLTGPSSTFLLGGFERIAAFAIQIALSLVVLLSFVKNDKRYLFAAIGLHALFDFVPALYRVNKIPLIAVEGIILIIAIVSVVFIIKSQKDFSTKSP